MIPAIVLAAGASSRMGRPKALLPLPGGQCFLARIVSTLRAAGIEEIIAVLGSGRPSSAMFRGSASAFRVVENPEPERGQLSSLLVGLDALLTEKPGIGSGGAGTPRAVLVTTVDLPLVSIDTVRAVVRAWQSSGAPVARPVRGVRHGHPVIFGAEVFDELRAADPNVGARAVMRAHAAEILDVPVDDAGAFEDIDTPADYERLVGLPFPR